MASDVLWIVSFKCVVKGYQDCRFEFTNRGTTQGTREFNQLSFLPQEQCFVILKQNTLLKVQGKTTLDNHKIDVHDVHDHPIIYFDFDLRRKIILLLHLLFILCIMAVRCSKTSNIPSTRLSLTLLVSIQHNPMDWVRLGSIYSIKFNRFGNRTHTKFGVRFGSIAEFNRTQSMDWVRLSSIFEHSIYYAGITRCKFRNKHYSSKLVYR